MTTRQIRSLAGLGLLPLALVGLPDGALDVTAELRQVAGLYAFGDAAVATLPGPQVRGGARGGIRGTLTRGGVRSGDRGGVRGGRSA